MNDEKLNFKHILPIFTIVLVDLLGLTIIIPLLPLYATAYGASPLLIGLLGAAYPIMQFIGAPLLGRLSDRYGRKPVLLVSQLGTLLGFLLIGFASTFWLLFVGRIIDGLSGANFSTAQAVISDSTSEKTRTQGLGLIGAAFGLGFTVGPVIAFVSLLLSGNNYQVPAFVAAACSAASLVLTWFWLDETHGPDKRGPDKPAAVFSPATMFIALRNPQVGLLLVLIFAQQVAWGGFEQLLSLFTLSRLGLNAAGNSVIFVFVGIVAVVVQGYYLGRWAKAWGDRKLIYIGLAALALGLAITALTPAIPPPWYSEAAIQAELGAKSAGQLPVILPSDSSTGWLGLLCILAAMIPASIGGGVLQPAINSMITKRVEANERGGILGISASFLSIANVLAPLMGGALFQAVNPSAPFWVWAALLAVLLAAAWLLLKPGREEEAPAGLARGGAASH